MKQVSFAVSAERLIGTIFIFAAIDFLVMPRVALPFYVPATLYLVIALAVVRVKCEIDLIFFFAILASISGSLLHSIFVSGDNFSDNLKRALQLLTVFSYYFAFLRRRLPDAALLTILRIFALYVFSISIVYVASPGPTAEFFWGLYPESLGSEQEALYYLRFQYVFQDPNSHAYFMAICLGLILACEDKLIFKIIAVAIFLIIILVTQSRGGLIAFGLISVYALFEAKLTLIKKIFASLALILAIALILLYVGNELPLLELLANRSSYEDDFGGGRMGKYLYFLSNFNYLPFGVGHYLSINGDEFRPHSDVIRLVQSYGLVVTSFFIYIIYPRSRKEVYILIPLAVCMLINTAINDYRIFGFYLLSLAFLRGSFVGKEKD